VAAVVATLYPKQVTDASLKAGVGKLKRAAAAAAAAEAAATALARASAASEDNEDDDADYEDEEMAMETQEGETGIMEESEEGEEEEEEEEETDEDKDEKEEERGGWGLDVAAAAAAHSSAEAGKAVQDMDEAEEEEDYGLLKRLFREVSEEVGSDAADATAPADAGHEGHQASHEPKVVGKDHTTEGSGSRIVVNLVDDSDHEMGSDRELEEDSNAGVGGGDWSGGAHHGMTVDMRTDSVPETLQVEGGCDITSRDSDRRCATPPQKRARTAECGHGGNDGDSGVARSRRRCVATRTTAPMYLQD
jgi:hypothetical protein